MRLWNRSCFCYHPPSSPFLPSFLSFFSQSIFFFFLFLVSFNLFVSRNLPPQWPKMFGRRRANKKITHAAWGPPHTPTNSPHLESAEETPRGGSSLWTHERFMRRRKKTTTKKNNFNQRRNIRKRRREDKGGRGEESKQGATLIVLSCRERGGGRRWLDKRRRRVRGDGQIDGMR